MIKASKKTYQYNLVMKTIIAVRHAKSSWDFPDLSDDQRPLLEKGKKRTRKVIEYLLKKKFPLPELIISSHAVRAVETARIFAHALKYPGDKIQISRSIYHGNKDLITDQLYGIDDDINCVMLVGHNPTLTAFANQFLDDPIDWIPTSGVVILQIDTGKWTEAGLRRAIRSERIFPREI
jgi:phosphohistidine phosphatase